MCSLPYAEYDERVNSQSGYEKHRETLTSLLYSVSSCSEVQYVVLQNVATMTIKRRVSYTCRCSGRPRKSKSDGATD